MQPARDWRLSKDGRIHRTRRKQYPNGDVYVGELVGGKRDGNGELTTVNGRKYSGSFYEGLFDGDGTFTWDNFEEDGKKVIGRKFIGLFRKGRRSGIGEYFDGFGNIWKGTWKDDRFTGNGILVKRNGEEREGNWLNGHLNCKRGSIIFANGNKYEGPVCFDKMHGEIGRYKYARSGGSYVGQYRRDLKHGLGTRCFMDNSVYQGDFVDGEQCGKGTMRYAHGPRKELEGQWENGRCTGKLIFQDGYDIKHITGLFYHGSPHGRAIIYFKDGGYYDGNLKCTQRDKERRIYDVSYPHALRHGHGLRVWSNGNKFEGVWEYDEMIEGIYCDEGSCSKYIGAFKGNKKNGSGMETWRSPNGKSFRDPCFGWLHKGNSVCKYEGQYINGYFHGRGNFVAPDGRSYNGDFLNGKQCGNGVALMLSRDQLGDKERMHIGKHGSLYRAITYIGNWDQGVRDGFGKLIYLNGLEIEGVFKNGHIHKEVNRRYQKDKCELIPDNKKQDETAI